MAENVNNSTTGEDRDYLYKLLGCDELSSEEQIIAEYKIKAKALHPDKNSDSVKTTDEFITLTKAKEILCDNEQRKQYDTWRRSGLNISFDVWLKTDQFNHMSMHWAPQPKKKKMIESCEAHLENTERRKSLTKEQDKTSINKNPRSIETCDKTIKWERKRSWGDSKLSRFRNYII